MRRYSEISTKARNTYFPDEDNGNPGNPGAVRRHGNYCKGLEDASSLVIFPGLDSVTLAARRGSEAGSVTATGGSEEGGGGSASACAAGPRAKTYAAGQLINTSVYDASRVSKGYKC